MGKPGSDAGMPGIEDSEVGKIDDVQFGKKPTLNFQEHFLLGQTQRQSKDTLNKSHSLSVLAN